MWADGRWAVSLTAEGHAVVDAYLTASPYPWRLLKACHPTTVSGALAAGMSMDDVNGECVLGVYRAAETFDPAGASQFRTYAVMWMRAAVGQAAARWARDGAGCRTGTALDAGDGPLGLAAGDLRRPPPDDAEAARQEAVAALHRALLAVDLPPRARTVLAHRFGLDGAEVLTLDKLATKFGVVRERIRQIQSWSLRRLYVHLSRPDLPPGRAVSADRR